MAEPLAGEEPDDDRPGAVERGVARGPSSHAAAVRRGPLLVAPRRQQAAPAEVPPQPDLPDAALVPTEPAPAEPVPTEPAPAEPVPTEPERAARPAEPERAGRRGTSRRRPSMAHRHDLDGRRVRRSIAWFVAVLATAYVGAVHLGLVLGLAAALAAEQVVRTRAGKVAVRRGGRRLPVPRPAPPPAEGRRPAALAAWCAGVVGDPTRLVAVLGGLALPLAAAAGPDTLTAAVTAVVVVALAATSLAPAPAGPGSRTLAASSTVLAAVAFGGAGAAVVLLRGEGVAAVVILVLLVSAYELGDALVGSGTPRLWPGPLAGALAAAVVALGASLVALVPLGRTGPLVLAGVIVCLAPAGAPLVSALVGDGATPAGAARRLDVWLAVAPVAAWAGAVIAG